MTYGPPTSVTRTDKTFLYDRDRELIGFFEHSGSDLTAYYIVDGPKLEKYVAGPPCRKARIEFREDVALRYTPYGPLYTVNICARRGLNHTPVPLRMNESVDDMVVRYRVRDDLLAEWMRKAWL